MKDFEILKRKSISEVSACSCAKFIDFCCDADLGDVDFSVKVDGMAFSFGVFRGKFFTCSASLGPFFSDGKRYETPYTDSVASVWNARVVRAMKALDIAHSYFSTGMVGRCLREEADDVFYRCELLSNVSAREFNFADRTVTFNYVPYSLDYFGTNRGLGSLMSLALIKVFSDRKTMFDGMISTGKFEDGAVSFLNPYFSSAKIDLSVVEEIHRKFGSSYAAKKAMFTSRKDEVRDIVDRGKTELSVIMRKELEYYRDIIGHERCGVIPTVQNEGIVVTSPSGISLKLTDPKFVEFKMMYAAEDDSGLL